jgi:hypothetical protein
MFHDIAMTKHLFACMLLMIVQSGNAQRLAQVSFTSGGKLTYFSVEVDQSTLIRMSEDGKLLEWGTEQLSDRGNYYAPKLQPYMGRIEYYGTESDTLLKGKLRSIGTATITWYGAHEEESKRGKPKSIGNLQLDYYSRYDEKSMQGKLKMIGNLLLDYYRAYENETVRGKLKALGSTSLSYYTPFEDRYNAGKLKSVGSVPYTWYSEFDRAKGALKSNNYRQNIGGVSFILR